MIAIVKVKKKHKIIIRRATIKDVRKIAKLVAYYAKQKIMLFRTEAAIIQNLRDYFVASSSRGELLGCAALHIYTDRLSEVKALAVKKKAHSLGLGKRLVLRCLKEAKDLGVPKVFALTYVDAFFRRLGFVDSNRFFLPHKIWQECDKCARKDNCDEVCLVYTLKK